MPDYIWQLYDEARENDNEDIVRHYFPIPTNNDNKIHFDLYAINRRPNEEYVV
jgi:hypothetical protein